MKDKIAIVGHLAAGLLATAKAKEEDIDMILVDNVKPPETYPIAARELAQVFIPDIPKPKHHNEKKFDAAKRKKKNKAARKQRKRNR